MMDRPFAGLGMGLGSLPLLSSAKTRSISAENPDGDGKFPTICGTGTEDYFGGAWCFGDTYSTAYLGYPLWQKEEGRVPKHGLYRWHVMDPIRFEKERKVTIQALGWWPNRKYEPLTDDIASVAYWYQSEPHAAFPQMQPVHLRWPRL